MSSAPQYITLQAAAERLSFYTKDGRPSEKAVRRLIDAGVIPVVKLSKQIWRVPVKELEQAMDRLMVPAAGDDE